MTVQIESDSIADSLLTNGIFPPLVNGLVGFWDHRGTTDRISLNQWTGQQGGVVGTPTIEADGTTFTSLASYVDTLLVDTADMTWLNVARVVDPIAATNAGRPAFVGNFASTGGGGLALYMEGGTGGDPAGSLRASASYSATQVTALAQANATGWRLRAIRVAQGVGNTVNDLTEGTSAASTNVTTRIISTTTIRIGSAAFSSWQGRSKQLFTMGYNRRLSDTELATLRAWLQVLCTDVSGSIVI